VADVNLTEVHIFWQEEPSGVNGFHLGIMMEKGKWAFSP
jgi:hypothetical protein